MKYRLVWIYLGLNKPMANPQTIKPMGLYISYSTPRAYSTDPSSERREISFTLIGLPNKERELICPRIYIYIYKLATFDEGDLKAPFLIASTPRCRELLHFTLNPYLIMQSVKKGSIRYGFLSLWYDSTWDWSPVSLTIAEHSTH